MRVLDLKSAEPEGSQDRPNEVRRPKQPSFVICPFFPESCVLALLKPWPNLQTLVEALKSLHIYNSSAGKLALKLAASQAGRGSSDQGLTSNSGLLAAASPITSPEQRRAHALSSQM